MTTDQTHTEQSPRPSEQSARAFDVVVVGGGAAGLSAALVLGRARRSVLVIDSGEPRNARAGHVHNYLGREGTPPAELLAAGRAEVAGYGGEFLAGTVTAVDRHGDGDALEFLVDVGGERTVVARRVLVATGLVDELPDLPGLAEGWGRGVLHCPYCHGWEVRDQPIGVLATGPLAVHQALLWRQWSADVVLFRHTAALGEAEAEQLAARGVTVVDGEVAAVELGDGGAVTGVRLVGGRVVPRRAVTVAARMAARADLLAALGLRPVDLLIGEHAVGCRIEAGPTGATSVPGVFVAGNVTDLQASVLPAAAAGLTAAAALNADLVAEETRLAVEAHRREHVFGANA
ncbi:MAG: NAD(P)/FAD-dependent oxidoreductase [Frankia sp.]|nr:NAD(P)/FAD-dependent oxidoreductase [Frankia sp.]